MKKIILSLFLIISYIGSYSQSSSSNALYNKNSTDNGKKEIEVFKTYNNSLINIFLSEKWRGGNILLDDNTTLLGYVFKYNILTDEIEVKATINPTNVQFVSIGGRIFLYSDCINEQGKSDKGYFEVLVKGHCKLLLKRTIISEPINNIDMMEGKQKNAPKVEETYYVKKGNQPAFTVKKKKDLLENLSDKEGFAKYIDDKFIPILNKKNLIKLIDYYNQL